MKPDRSSAVEQRRAVVGWWSALQRLSSYVVVGGFASLINLVLMSLMYSTVPMPVSSEVHYLAAFAVVTEVSIVVNFLLNDRITFHCLPGHARPWGTRFVRYHSTLFLGVLVTLVVSFALHYWLGLAAVAAQAGGIAINLMVNYSMHHLWTYREMEAVDKVVEQHY